MYFGDIILKNDKDSHICLHALHGHECVKLRLTPSSFHTSHAWCYCESRNEILIAVYTQLQKKHTTYMCMYLPLLKKFNWPYPS